jgi:putative transposase
MMLTLNYTFRIYPNVTQQSLMKEWLETCRQVYNYSLRELKDWLASRKSVIDRCSLEKEYIIPSNVPFPSYQRQQDALPKAKKRFPRLAEIHSQVLQTTVRRLHDTWENFQKREFGFPRFKKFGQFKSLVFPQFKTNPVTSSQLKLPKIGDVAIRLHRPIPDGFIVKQVRVLSKARSTQWYVIITIESDVSIPKVPAHGRAIAIDLGLERFLTASDNSSVERPRFLKSLQSRLKVLQRRASRKKKHSNNWEKAQVSVARLHHKVANTRKDFHLKTAHNLCDQAQTIFAVSEVVASLRASNLNTVGLNRGMLRKDCVDASFGQFLSLLEWVCWKRGAYFLKVNPRGTSQICPECLATVSKPLSEREHLCPECGYRAHRDCAAAQMVLLRGLENYEANIGRVSRPLASLVPKDFGEWKLPGNGVLSGATSLDKCQSRNAQM